MRYGSVGFDDDPTNSIIPYLDDDDGTIDTEEPAPGLPYPKSGLWRIFPTFAVLFGLATYTTCRVLAATMHAYLGDIPFPFFSDTGRDPPAYYVFVVGLSLASACYLITFYCMFRRMGAWLVDARNFGAAEKVLRRCDRLRRLGFFFAIAASPFTVVLAVYDVSEYPLVHQTSADMYSTFSILATCTYTWFFWSLVRECPYNRHLALSTRIKTAVCAVWLVAFAIYIPVGLAITCPARLLGLEECESTPYLLPGYCESKAHPHIPGYTTLWTYKDCPVSFTMRTVAQFTCIVSVMLYAATFTFDMKPQLAMLRRGSMAVPGAARPQNGYPAKAPPDEII